MLRAVLLAALVAVSAAAPVGHTALAQSEHRSVLRVPAAATYPIVKRVTVGLHKAMVVELPREAASVHVSAPAKLDALLHSSRRIHLVGMEVGQANAFFFDKGGDQILTLEVVIERDLAALQAMLSRLMPGSDISVEAVNDTIVLTGRVRNAADAARVADLAGRLSEAEAPDGRSKVINMLTVESREQVLLKVTVAEIQRNTLKQLGVDVNAIGNFGAMIANPLNPIAGASVPLAAAAAGRTLLGGGTANGYTINNQTPPNRLTLQTTGNDGTIAGTIRAMERNGLIRTLAEPNLTAISGETANFLAGGEFPVPVGQDNDRITIEFKPFGVGLAFTPVVMSEGRISMKVSTEVSELSSDGAITLQNINIPALKVRRANTTIELPSGGSLVIAGLLSDETKQAIEGLPGLKNLPILGALFRSRDYIKRETELVVIVTPYVVDPTARQNLARPDDNFAPAGDLKTYFFGHLNRVYGREPKHMPVGSYKGSVGFIID